MRPRSEILEGFKSRCRLGHLDAPYTTAVYWYEALWDAAEEACARDAERLIPLESWGFVRQMIVRSRAYNEGALFLSATGCDAPAESLSRTCLESSLKVLYVLSGDPTTRLWSYFGDFFKTKATQTGRWHDALNGVSDDEKAIHETAIKRTADARSELDRIMSDVFVNGFGIKSQDPWPTVRDQFKSLGMELDYRTVYAAMCAQSHNDAEDLLNGFVAKVSGQPDMEEKLHRETRAFSRMLVFAALRSHVDEIALYATTFGLISVLGLARTAAEEVHGIAASEAARTRRP